MIRCERAGNLVLIHWPDRYIFAVRSIIGLSFKRCLKEAIFLDEKEFPKAYPMDDGMPEVNVKKNGRSVILSFRHNDRTIVSKSTISDIRALFLEVSNACEEKIYQAP